jgi:hypothetical protein
MNTKEKLSPHRSQLPARGVWRHMPVVNRIPSTTVGNGNPQDRHDPDPAKRRKKMIDTGIRV